MTGLVTHPPYPWVPGRFWDRTRECRAEAEGTDRVEQSEEQAHEGAAGGWEWGEGETDGEGDEEPERQERGRGHRGVDRDESE